METICAVSTPAGVGGIAVVRLSGSDAKGLAEGLLYGKNGRAVTLVDHKAKVCDFIFGNDVYSDSCCG